MQSLIRSSLAILSLATSTIAWAQTADVNTNPGTPGTRSSTVQPPAFTVHDGGSSKSILLPFGPYITQTGVGGGGANVSELYTTFTLGSSGYSIFGYGMGDAVNNHLADEFIVPGLEWWDVQSVKWLAYEVGASTTGSISSMKLNLWNTNPEGQPPGGQWVTGGQQFQSRSWTGVYRVMDNDLTSVSRAISQVTCSGSWIPTLSTGTYWIEATGEGFGGSGPWSPAKTKAGQVPPTGDAWNGLQSLAGGSFARVYDTGNPAGSIHEPADFLWQLEGGKSTCFGACSRPFCTSKSSSLGCTPTLINNMSWVSKSGTGLTQLTAAPVPGGPGLPGILIYSKQSPIPPVMTPFGILCLTNFARAGAFPATPGGTAGTCTGSYVWSVTALASSTPTIQVGEWLRFQGWYRDPGFPPPGDANFTNGIDGIQVAP